MSVDFVEGFEFDNGYLSPYMVTNPASLEAVLDDPYILLCSEKITKVQQLMPVLDKIMRAPRPLVIIAETVEGTALQMLVHNHVNGIFQCVAIQAPGFGDRRLHKLEDIAAHHRRRRSTAGTPAFALEQMTIEQLGRARQVRVTADRTTIIGGGGVRRRRSSSGSAQLRAELERATFGIDEDVLTERIGALSGKVAVIRVGAPTNAELSELQHRVEDALSATRAAMAEGIVAGGGVGAAARRAGAGRPRGRRTTTRSAWRSCARALTEPAYLIAANAGYDGRRGGRARSRRWASTRASTRCEGRYGNMVEMGIIDPLRVVPLGAAERRFGGRAAAHHQHPGRRGADALGRQPALMTEFGAAGRGPAPALAGLQHAAVARPRPVGRLRARREERCAKRNAGH